MEKFELDVIDSCIKLLSIDGIGSEVLVKRTLEALKSNDQYKVENYLTFQKHILNALKEEPTHDKKTYH